MSVSDSILEARASLTREEFERFLDDIDDVVSGLSPEEIGEVGKTIEHIEFSDRVERAKTDFLEFIKLIKPKTIFSSTGIHHRMAREYEDLVDGEEKRIMVCMPPRQSKSLFGSVCLPAWFIGKYPDKKIIQASASERLAKDFGRQVKEIVASPMFQKIFPGVFLSKDSQSNSKFATNHGGVYNAVGTSADVAGLGADLFVCDDVTTEQEAMSGNPDIYEKIWNWFLQGPQERLMPEGRICVIQTRWSRGDLIGKLLRRAKEDRDADQYRLIKFTALNDKGESNFPEFWPTKAILNKKRNTLPHIWAARYEQDPTSLEGVIIPLTAWRKWDKSFREINEEEVEYRLPAGIHTILMVFDTAYTQNKRSNPSAVTVWGIFPYRDPAAGNAVRNCAILIFSWQKKVEFPELKTKAKELVGIWKPDLILIEAKNIGPALRSDLSQAGIMSQQVIPKPYEDKVSRLVSVSDFWASGNVFYVPTHENQVAVNQIADFPTGDGDDYVDTTSYALRHYRKLGLIGTNKDTRPQPGGPEPEQPPANHEYY